MNHFFPSAYIYLHYIYSFILTNTFQKYNWTCSICILFMTTFSSQMGTQDNCNSFIHFRCLRDRSGLFLFLFIFTPPAKHWELRQLPTTQSEAHVWVWTSFNNLLQLARWCRLPIHEILCGLVACLGFSFFLLFSQQTVECRY